jgi:hypothetical protein
MPSLVFVQYTDWADFAGGAVTRRELGVQNVGVVFSQAKGFEEFADRFSDDTRNVGPSELNTFGILNYDHSPQLEEKEFLTWSKVVQIVESLRGRAQLVHVHDHGVHKKRPFVAPTPKKGSPNIKLDFVSKGKLEQAALKSIQEYNDAVNVLNDRVPAAAATSTGAPAPLFLPGLDLLMEAAFSSPPPPPPPPPPPTASFPPTDPSAPMESPNLYFHNWAYVVKYMSRQTNPFDQMVLKFHNGRELKAFADGLEAYRDALGPHLTLLELRLVNPFAGGKTVEDGFEVETIALVLERLKGRVDEVFVVDHLFRRTHGRADEDQTSKKPVEPSFVRENSPTGTSPRLRIESRKTIKAPWFKNAVDEYNQKLDAAKASGGALVATQARCGRCGGRKRVEPHL